MLIGRRIKALISHPGGLTVKRGARQFSRPLQLIEYISAIRIIKRHHIRPLIIYCRHFLQYNRDTPVCMSHAILGSRKVFPQYQALEASRPATLKLDANRVVEQRCEHQRPPVGSDDDRPALVAREGCLFLCDQTTQRQDDDKYYSKRLQQPTQARSPRRRPPKRFMGMSPLRALRKSAREPGLTVGRCLSLGLDRHSVKSSSYNAILQADTGLQTSPFMLTAPQRLQPDCISVECSPIRLSRPHT